jgi:hypothetical protein
LELLVRSGLWAQLAPPAQQLAAVLVSLAHAEKLEYNPKEEYPVKVAYTTLIQYSGIRVPKRN